MSELERELAKAAGKAVLDVTQGLMRGVGRIFGPAADELGATLGERMRYWRFKNLNDVLNSVERIRAERGIHPDALEVLPFGDAARVVEAASFEEEPSVQELWARLLANSTVPGSQITIKKPYVDILRSLSPAEAMFLDLIWRCEQRSTFKRFDDVKEFNLEMNAAATSTWRKRPDEDRRSAIQNLVRIRCITFRPRPLTLGRLFAQIPSQGSSPFEKWAAVNPEEFQKVLNQIGELIFAAAGVKDYTQRSAIPLSWGGAFSGGGLRIEVPEMNFMLTSLGNDLMRACDPGDQTDTGRPGES